MTNMCKDKDFISLSKPIGISTDAKVNETYGEVLFLGRVDPKNFQKTIETTIHEGHHYVLGEGTTQIPFDVTISQDSEIGIKLSYFAFSKVNDVDSPGSWCFFEALKYCSKFKFTIHNRLGKDFKLNLARINKDGTRVEIKTNHVLPKDEHLLSQSTTAFRPGDQMSFYLHKP